ncbi:hypothetical protein F4823DRAFT_568290 [Ustulina deusta]|nr:hypothetical protein F4823DRAFT_568290 [Ustulina deusta]
MSPTSFNEHRADALETSREDSNELRKDNPSANRNDQEPTPRPRLKFNRATVKFDREEDDLLKQLLELDIGWSERLSRFQENFGTLRILESLRQRSLHVKKDCPSYLDRAPSNWTQEEDASTQEAACVESEASQIEHD